MTEKTITINPEDYFHARPAAQVATAARSFKSIVMVMLDTEIADGKDALSLMRLSRPCGRPVQLIADGPDENEALEAVTGAIISSFKPQ